MSVVDGPLQGGGQIAVFGYRCRVAHLWAVSATEQVNLPHRSLSECEGTSTAPRLTFGRWASPLRSWHCGGPLSMIPGVAVRLGPAFRFKAILRCINSPRSCAPVVSPYFPKVMVSYTHAHSCLSIFFPRSRNFMGLYTEITNLRALVLPTGHSLVATEFINAWCAVRTLFFVSAAWWTVMVSNGCGHLLGKCARDLSSHGQFFIFFYCMNNRARTLLFLTSTKVLGSFPISSLLQLSPSQASTFFVLNLDFYICLGCGSLGNIFFVVLCSKSQTDLPPGFACQRVVLSSPQPCARPIRPAFSGRIAGLRRSLPLFTPQNWSDMPFSIIVDPPPQTPRIRCGWFENKKIFCSLFFLSFIYQGGRLVWGG